MVDVLRRPRSLVAVALVAALAFLVGPVAARADSDGTVSTLRSAATRFVTAELAANGADACAVLNAPLTKTVGGQTCAQRWTASLRAELSKPGMRHALRADLVAIPSAPVSVSANGYHGTISLPTPLLDGSSRFFWTANCWMLQR